MKAYDNYEMYSLPVLPNYDWQFNGNIDWRKVKGEKVEAHQINEVIKVLERAGYNETKRKKGAKDITSMTKLYHAYYVRKISQDFIVYWYEQKGDYVRPHKITTFMPNELDEIEGRGFTGRDAYKYITAEFTRRRKKFSTVYKPIDKQYQEMFKACVPPPLNFGANGTYTNCFKCDVSSAYAYEGSKRLPTFEGAQRVAGIAAPTDEFPFAFYPFDMSLSILEEDGTIINTKEFWNHPYFDKDKTTLAANGQYMARDGEVKTADFPKFTFLLKATSDDTLATIFRRLYEKRQEPNNHSKEIMNYFIGFTHRSAEPEHAYIGAVIIARCVHRMLSLADKIESLGINDVILIATDSIAWAGIPMPHLWTEQEKKQLGSFAREYYGVSIAVKGAKCYQIKDKEEIKTVWSGINRTLTESLNFGDIFTKQFKTNFIKWSVLKHRLINEKGDIL